jgi:flagellar hook assembly protein FlgD
LSRKFETDKAIPSAITTYRSAVRTATGTIETAINACDDLDDFKALFVVPMDSQDPPQPTGNAPIYDFPEEV